MTNTTQTTYLEALTNITARFRDEVALLTPDRRDTTYGQLFEHNELIRNKLAQFGINRGSRIGLVIPTRHAMVGMHIAALTTGASVPLNPAISIAELRFDTEDFRLDAVVIEEGLDELHQLIRSMGVKCITLVPDREQAAFFDLHGEVVDENAVPEPPHGDDVALLLHTSGTTSRPKIVAKHQERQVGRLFESRGDVTIHPGNRVPCALPLHHTQGLNSELMMPLLVGASVVVLDFDPRTFIGHMEHYKVTKFTLVPSMHRMVLEHVKDRRDIFKGTPTRWISSSSAALTVKTRLEMEPIYGVPIIEEYGSTEAGPAVIRMGFDQSDLPLGSVGKRAHDGVAIMDEEGNELPPYEVGEIWIKHERNITSYENNPEANAIAFRDGYYRTGDTGYFDENDYLFIKGRLKETISRGGENISPAEIDDVLLQHPDIGHAAAFGVSDERLEQEIWAAVVPLNGSVLNPGAIRAFAASKLPFAKVPKRVVVVDKLPMSDIGKLLRRELSDRYSRKSDAVTS